MDWAVALLGCHSWRSILRAARDWASPAGWFGMSLLSMMAAHSCSAVVPNSLRRMCRGIVAS